VLLAMAMVATLVGGVTAGEAAPAGAAITPQTNAAGALAISQALASSANVTGSSFLSTTGGTPNGTSNSALAGFPTDGSTFGILTSGNVSNVPNAGTFASTSNGGAPVRGDTDMDVSILKTDVSVPSGANCLTFDFKFLSEEYPNFVGGSVNDAFVAEYDSSTWTTSANTITAPNNFAFDSTGQVVSINSTGVGGMTAADGAGTAFDGNTEGAGTGVLHASHQVTPGAHSLYFSIFDQGDTIYDSAVFLDNLRVGFVPNPAVNCVAGASVVTANLALTPATATSAVGTPHTVTATLKNGTGNPIAGAPLTFTATGANTASGTGTTNASGVATFTYTGTNVGTDQIGACYDSDNAAPCEATASATKDWTAAVPTTRTLTATVAGSGTVTSSPAGVSCPGTCSAPFTTGSSVSLTATPASGSTFTGWSGACTGTAACTLAMTTNRSVTATFTTVAPTTKTLTVGVTGSGSVTSSPAGISCPGTCSATFPTGTAVTLTPTAGAESTFTGWSNGCTGTGACVVTLTGDATVNAAFTAVATGNLVVSVESNPPTVTAGRAAQETYTVTNTGDGDQTNSTIVINFPAGSTIVSNDPGQGSCTVSGTTLTCSLGTIASGGNVVIPVVVTVPASFTGTFIPTATVSSDQNGTTAVPDLTGPDTEPFVVGNATGFVPPGGSITTGPATGDHPTGGTFSLPNSGPGAPISLTTSALPAGFCGGHTCRGRLLTLSPFAGYTDPNHPAVLDISLDKSRVALWGPSFNVWVQKEDSYAPATLVPDCKNKVEWAKFWYKCKHHWVFFWYIKSVKKIAKPSPCVAKRYIDSNGDSHTKILILSGDPKFARR
jgi:Bacterial Ig-like domain (group 1)/Divergent InlB B-repeat domain/Domain of unknown function DUF11